jgi:hypothetical protein
MGAQDCHHLVFGSHILDHDADRRATRVCKAGGLGLKFGAPYGKNLHSVV